MIFDRIKQVRKALGFESQNTFAAELEMKPRTYQTYEQGSVNSIPHTFLCLLNEQYNVSLNWLLTGKGEMYDDKERNSLLNSKANIVSEPKQTYNSIENKLINNIKQLSNKQQEYYYHRIKADVIQNELQQEK